MEELNKNCSLVGHQPQPHSHKHQEGDQFHDGMIVFYYFNRNKIRPEKLLIIKNEF